MQKNVNQSCQATLYICYYMGNIKLKVILYDNNKKIIFSGNVSDLWLCETERVEITELAEQIVSILLEKNIKTIRVYLKGRSASNHTILDIIKKNKIEIYSIRDITSMIHNDFLPKVYYKKKTINKGEKI